jgi:hypothetical protein
MMATVGALRPMCWELGNESWGGAGAYLCVSAARPRRPGRSRRGRAGRPRRAAHRRARARFARLCRTRLASQNDQRAWAVAACIWSPGAAGTLWSFTAPSLSDRRRPPWIRPRRSIRWQRWPAQRSDLERNLRRAARPRKDLWPNDRPSSHCPLTDRTRRSRCVGHSRGADRGSSRVGARCPTPRRDRR